MLLIDKSDALKRFIKEVEDSGNNCIHINEIKKLLSDIPVAYRIKEDDAYPDLQVKEVMVNLKNHDFDVLGAYKMDEKEAKKLLDAFTNKGIFSTKADTNAVRIRNMTNEELAEFLCKVKSDYQWLEHEFPDEECSGEWVEWLESGCDVE